MVVTETGGYSKQKSHLQDIVLFDVFQSVSGWNCFSLDVVSLCLFSAVVALHLLIVHIRHT